MRGGDPGSPQGDATLTLQEALQAAVTRAPNPPEALRSVLEVLERHFHAAGALFYEVNQRGEWRLLGGSLHRDFTLLPHWFAHDPSQTEPGRVRGRLVRPTEMVSRRRFAASVAYREYYGPRQLEHLACLRVQGLVHGTPRSCGLMLGRGDVHGPLTVAEAALLVQQVPLLASLRRAAQGYQYHTKILSALGAEPLPVGSIVVLAEDGSLVWCSPRAHRMLQSVSHTEREELWRRAHAFINTPHRAAAPFIEVPLAERPWALRLHRHPVEHQTAVWVGSFCRTEDIESRLARIYRLTPAESAVLGCLVLGMSNATIGSHLEIAPSTAATHVKALLAKLGVRSRLQAGLLGLRAQLLEEVVPGGEAERDELDR